jgi:predicted NBD/HSP70 family sugar kinase
MGGDRDEGGAMRGSTMPDIGARNEMIVLQTIRHAPDGISQSEIIGRSGLSRQAVSLITRRLIDRGLVQTHGTLNRGVGKPRTMLRVVPRARLAAGIHLDPAGTSVVIVDLFTRVLARRTLDPPGSDPASDVRAIARALTALQEQLRDDERVRSHAEDVDQLLQGIGVAAPGGLDAVNGVLANPPWLPAWWGIPLTQMLEDATGLPAVLDKDTNAALAAENWSHATASEETVLYIYVGAGIGSAVSSRGDLHRGATTLAGEIGHLPTGLDGPVCGCGRRSCLSMYTDIRTLLDRARERGVPSGSEDPGMLGQLSGLVGAAVAGDPAAVDLVSGHGIALGEALRTLISVHDPDRVIIGGPYWDALAPFTMPYVTERALRSDARGRRVEIVSSRLGDDVGAVGAATVFLERELSPSRL